MPLLFSVQSCFGAEGWISTNRQATHSNLWQKTMRKQTREASWSTIGAYTVASALDVSNTYRIYYICIQYTYFIYKIYTCLSYIHIFYVGIYKLYMQIHISMHLFSFCSLAKVDALVTQCLQQLDAIFSALGEVHTAGTQTWAMDEKATPGLQLLKMRLGKETKCG